jgi:hypothetical protein
MLLRDLSVTHQHSKLFTGFPSNKESNTNSAYSSIWPSTDEHLPTSKTSSQQLHLFLAVLEIALPLTMILLRNLPPLNLANVPSLLLHHVHGTAYQRNLKHKPTLPSLNANSKHFYLELPTLNNFLNFNFYYGKH